MRVAIIVNDVGQMNLDEALIKDAKLVRRNEELVELSNGCICCTRRQDLLEEIRELACKKDETDATKRRFDVLVIESTGVSDPAGVVLAFEDDDELASLARLDTLVTVVDTAAFESNFSSLSTYMNVFLKNRDGQKCQGGDDVAEGMSPKIIDLLVSQVECANGASKQGRRGHPTS